MKLLLALVVCLGAVSAYKSPLLDKKSDLSKDAQILSQCLAKHNINEDVLDINSNEKDESNDKYEKLTNDQKGCVAACVFKSVDVLKPDGTFDYSSLLLNDTPKELEEEKKKFEKIISECKAEAGGDECKFGWCFQNKDS